MATITISFVGQWRLYLGVKAVSVEVNGLNEVKDLIEDHFGSIFQKKFRPKAKKENPSIWDNSNILLNGKNIRNLKEPVLKDGDIIEFLPKVAGG